MQKLPLGGHCLSYSLTIKILPDFSVPLEIIDDGNSCLAVAQSIMKHDQTFVADVGYDLVEDNMLAMKRSVCLKHIGSPGQYHLCASSSQEEAVTLRLLPRLPRVAYSHQPIQDDDSNKVLTVASTCFASEEVNTMLVLTRVA